MKQHLQTDLEADRQVANVLAELIIGGSLASVEVTSQTGGTDAGKAASNPLASGIQEPLPSLEGALDLVAGAGFGPATSGL
jgi:hypothetical protein